MYLEKARAEVYGLYTTANSFPHQLYPLQTLLSNDEVISNPLIDMNYVGLMSKTIQADFVKLTKELNQYNETFIPLINVKLKRDAQMVLVQLAHNYTDWMDRFYYTVTVNVSALIDYIQRTVILPPTQEVPND